MKYLSILIILGTTLLFSDSMLTAGTNNNNKHIATCTGSKTCYACKNCKYCGHCRGGGGTCGVCSSSVPPVKTTVKPKDVNINSVSSQCKGTTKKGARCKRMVKGGGYCWQHN